MEGKFSRAWRLVKMSAAVLQADKKLLVYPVISTFAMLILSAVFIIPLFGMGAINGSFSIYKPATLPYFILFYLLLYTVIIFSNSALVGAVIIQLNDRKPTIADGYRVAWNHIGAIIGYAFIASTVGIILNILQEKLGILGKIVTFIADLAWNVITFLIVPVLVVEGTGPIEAVKRSAHLLKKTWGEQIIGNIGIGYFFGFITMGMLFVFIPLVMYAQSIHMITLTILISVVGGFSFLLMIIISSTLDTVYRVILYRYATEGTTEHGFDEQLLKSSFKQK